MASLRLRIDISGTVGDDAWDTIRHFDMIQNAKFGPKHGMGGPCLHSPQEIHPQGEWWGAEIEISNSLLAQYAIIHYLEQERVLDADIV